jgi:hypothetical protein
MERGVLVVTALFGILNFTFTLGSNWTGVVKQTQSRIEKLETDVPKTYVRTDVYASDRARLTDAVDRLTRTLDELNRVQQAEIRSRAQ